jgi:hypothetical protein
LVARVVKFAQKMLLPNLELILSFDEPYQITATTFGTFWRGVLPGRGRERSAKRVQVTIGPV